MGSSERYRDKVELVLVLLSNLYSKLDSISVRASSTLLIHLILSTDYLTTDYCPNKIVYEYL